MRGSLDDQIGFITTLKSLQICQNCAAPPPAPKKDLLHFCFSSGLTSLTSIYLFAHIVDQPSCPRPFTLKA